MMTLPQSRRLDFSEIPILDIGPLVAGDDDPTLINDLYRACADVGFFYIRNHGVPTALIESVMRAAEGFFAAPMEEKMEVVLDQRVRGFYAHNTVTSVGHLIEGEDRSGVNCKEGFWAAHERPLSDVALLHGPNQWPKRHPELKHSMQAYFDATEDLADVLLRGFARALGLEEKRFDSLFDAPLTSLLINYYPPQENPTTERNIGLSPHFDAGGFTILWQDDRGGLEIQNKSGEWVEAPPIDGTFVINIGNILQLWTNGKFSSTPHRVVNRGKHDRFSIPLFVNPSYDVEVEPLVDTDREHPDPFTYGTYQRDVWRQTFPIAAIPN